MFTYWSDGLFLSWSTLFTFMHLADATYKSGIIYLTYKCQDYKTTRLAYKLENRRNAEKAIVRISHNVGQSQKPGYVILNLVSTVFFCPCSKIQQVELQRRRRDGLGRRPQQREPVLGIPLWAPWALKKKSQGTITIPFFTLSLLFLMARLQRHTLVSNLSSFINIFLWKFGSNMTSQEHEFWPRLPYPCCFFHQWWFSLALNEGLHYQCVFTQTAPPKGHASKFLNLN